MPKKEKHSGERSNWPTAIDDVFYGVALADAATEPDDQALEEVATPTPDTNEQITRWYLGRFFNELVESAYFHHTPEVFYDPYEQSLSLVLFTKAGADQYPRTVVSLFMPSENRPGAGVVWQAGLRGYKNRRNVMKYEVQPEVISQTLFEHRPEKKKKSTSLWLAEVEEWLKEQLKTHIFPDTHLTNLHQQPVETQTAYRVTSENRAEAWQITAADQLRADLSSLVLSHPDMLTLHQDFTNSQLATTLQEIWTQWLGERSYSHRISMYSRNKLTRKLAHDFRFSLADAFTPQIGRPPMNSDFAQLTTEKLLHLFPDYFVNYPELANVNRADRLQWLQDQDENFRHRIYNIQEILGYPEAFDYKFSNAYIKLWLHDQKLLLIEFNYVYGLSGNHGKARIKVSDSSGLPFIEVETLDELLQRLALYKENNK